MVDHCNDDVPSYIQLSCVLTLVECDECAPRCVGSCRGDLWFAEWRRQAADSTHFPSQPPPLLLLPDIISSPGLMGVRKFGATVRLYDTIQRVGARLCVAVATTSNMRKAARRKSLEVGAVLCLWCAKLYQWPRRVLIKFLCRGL